MEELEVLVGLVLAAVILAAAARRVGAPYPVFLALGGAILAFVPGAPSFTVLPELALALFVAPVLLDAAYDASPRDLRDNWAPVTGLVVFAVGLTTIAVAVVARALVPGMPWAPAIALGAVVAPPDAAAATAVLRQLRPPHRILTILEGESLLNDASALLIYRLAVGAVAANGFSIGAVAPTFLFAVAGSVVVGPVLGWLTLRLTDRVQDVPTAIILQFVSTFGVWILADRIGLSGVLTMVCYAMYGGADGARAHPGADPHSVLRRVGDGGLRAERAGLHLHRPANPPDSGEPRAGGARTILCRRRRGSVTVIVVRIAWHMSFNAVIRWRDRRLGFHPPRPMLRPTVGSGLVISWAGMRGIVSLAAALALPAAFPFRDLIVLTAFSVVLGTLAIQGLTLEPLLRALDLRDDDPVGHEVGAARERALRAGLARFEHDRSPVAEAVRQEFTAHLGSVDADPEDRRCQTIRPQRHSPRALQAARQAVLAMRASDEIGDDAFHQMEEELDWIEMAGGAKRGDEALFMADVDRARVSERQPRALGKADARRLSGGLVLVDHPAQARRVSQGIHELSSREGGAIRRGRCRAVDERRGHRPLPRENRGDHRRRARLSGDARMPGWISPVSCGESAGGKPIQNRGSIPTSSPLSEHSKRIGLPRGANARGENRLDGSALVGGQSHETKLAGHDSADEECGPVTVSYQAQRARRADAGDRQDDVSQGELLPVVNDVNQQSSHHAEDPC